MRPNSSVLFFLVSSLLLVLAVVAAADEQRRYASALSPRCRGVKNTIPIHTDDPIFVSKTRNGARYMGGSGNDTFLVSHLYGTWYDMGYAQGQLFKKEIPEVLVAFNNWMARSIERHYKDIPLWLAEIIAAVGWEIGLDYIYNATVAFTPNHFLDEMHGIADGAGVPAMDIIRYNLYPELIKAGCTIYGANGPATMQSRGGTIVHLRGLDFDPGAPIVDFASMTVYHLPNGLSLANFGWLGMIGSLTGFSSTSIGIGEKRWGPANDSAISSIYGKPWTYILRDVLLTPNMTEAIKAIKDVNRTCPIHAGVGDSVTNSFFGFEFAAKYYKIFDDRTKTPYPEHPYFPGIVYWEKSEPSHSFCLADLTNATYGDITAEWAATTLAAMVRTGDMHAATFDYQSKVAFFANSRKSWDTEPTSPEPAYARMWTRLDLAKLFNMSLSAH